MQVATALKAYEGQGRGPYICPKCNNNFEKFDVFNTHIKGVCVMESVKKPYCIIYKGPNEPASNRNKLTLSVDDYFYGHVEGSSKYKKRIIHRKFSCYSCGKLLRNNLRFMSHVRHKIENELKENDSVNDFNICSHCHRRYTSPFHLQCHIETVHTTVPAATTCRICELNFENEELFLCHMRHLHNYNELPYECKVCSYRSSFYLDLVQHFRLSHENCSSLQCPFCLAIHNTANSFLTHVIQHMNKSFRCNRCRLQFVNSKDKTHHLENDHASMLNIPGKRMLPKNLANYTIYVKVSHHPLSPTKNRPSGVSKSSRGSNSSAFAVLNMEEGWMMDDQQSEGIPVAFKPFARSSNVFVLSPLNAAKMRRGKCAECRKVLGQFASTYNSHFRKEYRCSKCSFRTHCGNAVKNHIIKNHLNHMPQGGASEKLSPQKPPIAPACSVATANARQDQASSSTDSHLSPKGKKIFFEHWGPGRKRVKRSHSPIQNNEHEKKRKDESTLSTRQRRKQLKPLKVTSNDEDLHPDSASSPVLKPLSKVVDEEAGRDWMQSTPPPPDPCTDLDDADVEWNENCETSQKSSKKRKHSIKMNFKRNKSRETSAPAANMLPADFASQLGLGKKEEGGRAKDASSRGKSRVFVANPPPCSPALQYEPSTVNPSYGIKWIQQPITSTPRVQPVNQIPFPLQPSTAHNILFPGAVQLQSIMRKPSSAEMLRPPTNITFSEVTKSSFLVSWVPPTDCSVTQYKLIFQGSGLPTTQLLPPAQTSVRLIGLRSSTCYLVRLCSVYKKHCSLFAESTQRTLGLREKKNAAPAKVDDVIVVEDDDDDVIPVTKPPSPQLATPLKLPLTNNTTEKETSNLQGISIDLTEEGEAVQSQSGFSPNVQPILPKLVASSRPQAIIIPDLGPNKKVFLINKAKKVSGMKMIDIKSLKLVKSDKKILKTGDFSTACRRDEISENNSKPEENNGNAGKVNKNQTENPVNENQSGISEANPSVYIHIMDDASEKGSSEVIVAGASVVEGERSSSHSADQHSAGDDKHDLSAENDQKESRAKSVLDRETKRVYEKDSTETELSVEPSLIQPDSRIFEEGSEITEESTSAGRKTDLANSEGANAPTSDGKETHVHVPSKDETATECFMETDACVKVSTLQNVITEAERCLNSDYSATTKIDSDHLPAVIANVDAEAITCQDFKDGSTGKVEPDQFPAAMTDSSVTTDLAMASTLFNSGDSAKKTNSEINDMIIEGTEPLPDLDKKDEAFLAMEYLDDLLRFIA